MNVEPKIAIRSKSKLRAEFEENVETEGTYREETEILRWKDLPERERRNQLTTLLKQKRSVILFLIVRFRVF